MELEKLVELEKKFQWKIDNDIKIEPNDWMSCNKERIDARRKAKEDGEWVREAAMAFAQKRKNKNRN